MKGNLLKRLNEITPDFVKQIMGKKIRNKVIENKFFKSQYEELINFDKLSEEDKENLHFEKVKEVLIYAYENTEYYKKQFNKIEFSPYDFKDLKELEKLPTINKQGVMDNFEDLTSKEEINYYTAYTGGSTGKPLKMFLDINSTYKERAFVYYYWSKYGYNYRISKTATFRGLEFKDKICKYNPIDNQIIFNPFLLNEDTIDNYIKKINRFNPEFIHGYASAVYNFCKLLKHSNVKLRCNIKSVCFISENVEDEQRKFIEETLNCTSNIFYGHSERIVFSEFYDNSYKFNDLYTHVDFLAEEEEGVYKMACTGLVSRKIPLIRYVPDDVAIIRENKIQIKGHWDKELLIGKNKEKISIASINFHNDIFNKVRLYQFEQFEAGKVTLNIVGDEVLTGKDLDDIKKIINRKLKNIMEIEVKIVDNIELTARGKHKKIKQHIKL